MRAVAHRIDANGLRHFIRDSGDEDAPAAILLHGFPDSSAVWNDVTPLLVASGFRVIAPDMRGFGETDIPETLADYDIRSGAGADVIAILDHLKIERAHLVGHDFGAAVAWALPSPGFEPWHSSAVSVTVPADSGRRSRRTLAVHHVMSLPAPQVTRDSDGYPLTTISRTAVDLADGLELPQQLVLLDAAARQLCASFVSRPRRSDYANQRLADAAREQLGLAAAGHQRRFEPAIRLVEPAR